VTPPTKALSISASMSSRSKKVVVA